MGTWRLTPIWVVNWTPALGAVAPVLKRVDVGNVRLRGQAFEEGVVVILSVGAEHGELVGGVRFTAQQEGERHKDSRLYWSSGDEQCSQESVDMRGESKGFLWWSTGHHQENGEMSESCQQGEEREGRLHP
jgi:hypothetical protein